MSGQLVFGGVHPRWNSLPEFSDLNNFSGLEPFQRQTLWRLFLANPPALRVMTPQMHTPGPSNGEPRQIPQGPLRTTSFEVETLRVEVRETAALCHGARERPEFSKEWCRLRRPDGLRWGDILCLGPPVVRFLSAFLLLGGFPYYSRQNKLAPLF